MRISKCLEWTVGENTKFYFLFYLFFTQSVGIAGAYVNALQNVTLAGPTLFSQVIETFAAAASTPYTATSQHYHVLLIITDGVISDFQNTIDRIVASSFLPTSIVIVGVG